MNKFIVLASVAAVTLSSSVLAAENKYTTKRRVTAVSYKGTTPHNYYVSMGIGLNKSKVKTSTFTTIRKNAPGYSFGFGGDLDGTLRGDITIDINSKIEKRIGVGAEVADINYQSYMVMGNLYHHLDNFDTFSPYMTGGLGYTKQKVAISSATINTKTSKGKLGGQVGFGVSYNTYNKVMFDLGYRFAYMGKLNLKNISNTSLKTTQHKVLASVRIPF